MYIQTEKQIEAEKKLVAQGFDFSNWIGAYTENDNEGCMVFTKHPHRGSTHYRQVEPDGSIN